MRTILVGWLVAAAIGCAAAGEPASGRQGAQRSAAEAVDLTGAHLDKRKFLLGVSMLGKSVEQDVEILRKITGHTFEPKEEQGQFPEGDRRFTEFVPFFKGNALLVNGSYWYRIYDRNRYQSSIRIAFDKKRKCISVEDLETALGKPTRIVSAGEVARKGVGPSYVWDVIYDHSSGARSVIAFSTDVCANAITHSSIRKYERP